MTISTPADIVQQALRRSGIVGVGQTAEFEDSNDGFDQLNNMISLWNRRRWLVYALEDVSFVSTGATSFTVGTGQQFNTPRPDRLEAAYARLLPVQNNQPLDTPLGIIESREDYGTKVALKNLQSWPIACFYDSQFPVANLFMYPVPPANQYEIHIIVKNQIQPFTSLSEVLSASIPPEYFEAMIWNLAARLRPAYQLPPDPQVTALALVALNAVRGANLQVPTLTMPMGYPTNRGQGYGWINGVTGGFF